VQHFRQCEHLGSILSYALSEDLERMAAQKPTCSTNAYGPPLQRFVEKGLPAAAAPGVDVTKYCANLDALADLYAALCRPDVDWWFINDEEMGKLAAEAVDLRMSRQGYDLQVTPHAGYVGASQRRFVMHAGGGISPERVFYQTSVQSIRIVPKKKRKS
jgi:hypothetical protein